MGKGSRALANKAKDAINQANSNPTAQNEAEARRLNAAVQTVRENKRGNQRATNGL